MFNKDELLFIANKLNASIDSACKDANDVANYNHMLNKIGQIIHEAETNGEDVPTGS